MADTDMGDEPPHPNCQVPVVAKLVSGQQLLLQLNLQLASSGHILLCAAAYKKRNSTVCQM